MPRLDSGGFLSVPLTLRAVLFASLYCVLMVLSIQVTRFGGQVSPIWIASAVMGWALISAPTRHWPVLIGVVAAAHLLGAYFVHDQWQVEIPYLIANMASPLIFAALLRWRGDTLAFEDRGEVFRFLLSAGAASSVSVVIVAAAELLQSHALNSSDLFIWFLSDSLGFVAFVPVVMTIARGDWRDLLAPHLRVRSVVMFAILIAALALIWLLPTAPAFRIFTLLLVPYLIFIAYDLGLTGARAAIAVAATGLVIYVMFAPAPPGRGLEPRDFILVMQVYIAVMCLCVLPLAAALAEKQALYENASSALADAQAAWGELLAAEAHYRLIADNAADMVVRLGLDGTILFASPAWSALTEQPETLSGRLLADIAHADDGARVRAEIVKVVNDGVLDRPHLLQLRLHDMNDVWRSYEARVTLVAPGGGDHGELVAVLRQVQE